MEGDDVQRQIFASALSLMIRRHGQDPATICGRLAQRRVPLEQSTLESWLAAQVLPTAPGSLRILAEIEQLLDEPPGILIASVTAPPPRRTPPKRHDDGLDAIPTKDLLRSFIEPLAIRDEGFDHTSVEMHMYLGTRGEETRSVNRRTVTAHEGGIPRWVSGFVLDEALCDTARIVPTKGCVLGKTLIDVRRGAFLAEMMATDPVSSGQVSQVEYEIISPAGAPRSFHYSHTASRTYQRATIAVTFDPGTTPTSVEGLQLVDDAEEPVPVEWADEHTASIILTSFGPGTAGLRWDWED